MIAPVVVGVLLYLTTSLAAADVYRCMVDGKAIYSDRPCSADATTVAIPPSQEEAARAEQKAKSAAKIAAARARTDLPSIKCGPTDRLESRAEPTKEAARQAILRSLKDPYSARFELLSYARIECTDGMFHAVCASVNAKNSYGGYTGSDLWIYRVDDHGRGGLVAAITDPKDLDASFDRLTLISAITDACVKAAKK